MNKPLKYSIFLTVLGIIAGFLLAFVNSITAPVIEARKKEEVKKALQEHFDYQDFSVSKIANYNDKTITDIFFAFDNNKLAAVIYQTKASGYQSDVVALVSIKADGTFEKVVMIDEGETSGIGTNVYKHDFKITGEAVTDYSYELMGGATRTSSAVAKGIDAAAKHFKTIKDSLGGITNE